MKLQYKHQQFQIDAADAVCDVFAGQARSTADFLMDEGPYTSLYSSGHSTGYKNDLIRVPPEKILENIRSVQSRCGIRPSEKLSGRYNLTVEMETGTGKTYTYIRTMYELHRRYGWSKFIIVVPSVAIREGVYKTFQTTAEHFLSDYGESIHYFIYNSNQLNAITDFARSPSMQAMIINAQAFNAKKVEARRINTESEQTYYRIPREIIAQTNPILIIDEPQSVEGPQTKENLKKFHPLFTLRYSATPRETHNLVYRLDAMDAYNKHLVKKISVIGISQNQTDGGSSYVYLDRLNYSADHHPTAMLQFEHKEKSGAIRRILRKVDLDYDLYAHSGFLGEYKNNFIVKDIDGRASRESITFLNGITLHKGEVMGLQNEEDLRRLQIRQAIEAHIERERQLFPRGIKVLTLFFLDEVKNYRVYDAAGQAQKGNYARIFEEEYRDYLEHIQTELGENPRYLEYLKRIPPEKTHEGYFSIDKKGRLVDGKISKKEQTSDDASAYDLIMRNKEALLSLRTPVRFIFSHSALREGWDNPNVFQICTLKQSSSEVRKHQEIGRGLRLCVNQKGERMDESVLGRDVQQVNRLTVIASESYASYAKALQEEISAVIADRPRTVTTALFEKQRFTDANGRAKTVSSVTASRIVAELYDRKYIDEAGQLTDMYREARDTGTLSLSEDLAPYGKIIQNTLDSVYDGRAFIPEDGKDSRAVNIDANTENLAKQEFQELWARINRKSIYTVDFDGKELIRNAVAALDQSLHVTPVYYNIESGTMEFISSREALKQGTAFVQEEADRKYARQESVYGSRVKYDFIGRIASGAGLTRKDAADILMHIRKDVFDQFHSNPEEFISKAVRLIEEQKTSFLIQHITYHPLDDTYDTTIFTEASLRGEWGKNVTASVKNVYNYLLYDSEIEKDMGRQLDLATNVAVYVKLPKTFYISTPTGRYTPDWAIAFKKGTVKHIYFVAETKGSLSTFQLRHAEEDKKACAIAHFKAISGEEVKYEIVNNYESLLTEVMR